ncbi:MAG TPA: tetratricopeptide repeat protein [Bryobacteraceae bacterium]|nr:tetratricopeptide repeat protein [Bryobacteraceae bacterium]
MFSRPPDIAVLAFFGAALLSSLAGCARRPARAADRLAVVSFENLSSSLDLDWMRRAVPVAVVSDLAAASNLYAQTVDSVNAAYSIPASRVLEGYIVERNGRLEIHAALQDLKSHRTVQSFEVDGVSSGGPLPLANRLARELSPSARQLQIAPAALRLFGEALNATDRTAVLRGFESAAKDAPAFSMLYLDWARTLVESGDREGALKAVEAGERGAADAIDRAQLAYTAASIRGDVNARKNALESLVRLIPANPKVFQELAALDASQRRFQEAVANYEAAMRLDPDDPETWNQMGYAQAYQQNLAAARAALQHYQQLLPQENANALDSLGEVSFFLGDFNGAAKYFLDADQKNRGQFGAAELLKAAQARLMAGDLPGADALFQKYAALLPGSRAAYQRAQWEFLTGRRSEAMAGMEKTIAALSGDDQSVALSQMAIWKLQTGDSKAAQDFANRAAARAVSPLARNLSAACRVIARAPATSSGSPLADAFTLIFARQFKEATPLLEDLLPRTDPSRDGQVRTLLAWACWKTNRITDADRLLRIYPIPLSSGESVFASLVFPRFVLLRAEVFEQQGKRAEAKAAYQLFLKYAGDVPDIFSDEITARQNLGRL